MRGIEIAFAGRSNVGKSSLINALTGRNAPHALHTPGRTQELIFFETNGQPILVDMPGWLRARGCTRSSPDRADP
jgi:GTP-binding protein